MPSTLGSVLAKLVYSEEVDAAIDAIHNHLTADISALVRALQRAGLDSESLAVRSATSLAVALAHGAGASLNNAIQEKQNDTSH